MVVVGSLNVDLVVRVPRFPQPGETLTAISLAQYAGGKGANQAYGVARLGERVSMIGCVGDDAHGQWLTAHLHRAGVDVAQVRPVGHQPTGTALIYVDNRGQNQIVIVPGANASVRLGALKLDSAGVVLLQLEIPLATVEEAALAAHAAGAVVVLDPAPAAPLSPALLAVADWITPNESELLVLLGEPPGRLSPDEAATLGRRLAGGGVVVKLGDRGAVLLHGSTPVFVPACPVVAVDTTAAGDAFNAAFAVALFRGQDPVSAVRYACAAAACSVTRPGAQASMPDAAEVARVLA